jgi:hypothetical protein
VAESRTTNAPVPGVDATGFGTTATCTYATAAATAAPRVRLAPVSGSKK